MNQKNILRKRFIYLRKKKYFDIEKNFFTPLLNIFKLKFKNKNLNFAIYYPSYFEVNILKILETKYMLNKNVLLPVIEKNNLMNFFPWKNNEVLQVNKFGLLEPLKTKVKTPDVILVPVLAYDKDNYRLGYGKGFYDRYLSKLLKKNNKILAVGVAFSFQKYHKLPRKMNDVKLDFILTEKGIS